MKLTKKGGGAFNPHDEGAFRAVCVDVTPLVKQTSGKYGDREVFRLVFETDAPAREDGSRQCVWSRGFTPSLNEKANFRKFLRQWFGRDLTAAEEAEFDTDALLLGRAGQVTISHELSDNGETYATIVACLPYRENDPLKPSGKFTRKKDREDKGEEASYRGAASPTEPVREAEAVDSTQAGDDWAAVKVHVGKFAGVEVRDLDPEAIEKLNKNWVPNAGTTAADQRLVKALKRAQKELAAATAGEEY
jgi:hypothetical protein